MSAPTAGTGRQKRRIGRSIGALAAGFAAGIVLTVATDAVLHAVGFFPPPGQPARDGPLVAATVYRTIYGVLGGYLIARLAPYRPMLHALTGGAVGLIVSAAGAAATWNLGLGAHWYPLALIVLAVPTAWAGARLRERQEPGLR